MKRLKYFIFLGLFVLSGCWVARNEEASVTSEDGRYVARLYRESTGATNPHYFSVYLSASDTGSDFTTPSLDGIIDISNMIWKGRILTISHSFGNISAFSSRWVSKSGEDVEIRLNARCDGMCITHKREPDLKASGATTRDIVSSVVSSSGKLTALLTRETLALPMETRYRLRIITGQETEQEKWETMVLEAKDLEEPVIAWDEARPIVLFSYSRGEIVKFQNVWRDQVAYKNGGGEYIVETRLVPRCEGMCF